MRYNTVTNKEVAKYLLNKHWPSLVVGGVILALYLVGVYYIDSPFFNIF